MNSWALGYMIQYSSSSVTMGNLRQDMPTLGLNNVHVYDIMHSAYCKDQQCQKQCVSKIDRIGSGTNVELCNKIRKVLIFTVFTYLGSERVEGVWVNILSWKNCKMKKLWINLLQTADNNLNYEWITNWIIEEPVM